jgi:DNA-binding HxlR family transcriptional regulator
VKSTAKRSYDQWCAVARSLDILGDRWTLLLVRDLLIGPKRYTDLLDGCASWKRPA